MLTFPIGTLNKDTFINVYLNYSDTYPDAESNDGEFKTGKIKITTPKGDGKFGFEWCSFAVLSSIDWNLKVAYYFHNCSPITIDIDHDYGEKQKHEYVIGKDGLPVLRRMNTQVVRINHVERKNFKYINKMKKIHDKIEEIVCDKDKYRDFKDHTTDILTERFYNLK